MKTIGIIYNGATAQAMVNLDHAKAIGAVLTHRYNVRYYNIGNRKGLASLFADAKGKKIHLVFNNSAGKQGGDGSVEGMFDVLGIPYVGSGMIATAVSFDKKITKAVVAHSGVPIIEDLIIGRNHLKEHPRTVVGNIERTLGYPVVVKASGGSDSLGISYVEDRSHLLTALRQAAQYDDRILVERYIKRTTEVTCMVVGNGKNLEAFVPMECIYKAEILSAQDKMDDNFICRPMDALPSLQKAIQRYTMIAHRAVGCSDYSRSDFLIDTRGKIYFLEINAHAGLGHTSFTVFAAKAARRWSHKTLVNRIVTIALARIAAAK